MTKINKTWFLFCGLVLGLLFIVVFPAARVIQSRSQVESVQTDNHLRVENNAIYIDDREVYRFIPVDGGDARLGGASSFSYSKGEFIVYEYTHQHIKSFLIGETPVTKELWEYVVADKMPENPVGYYLYPHTFSYKDWFIFLVRLRELTGRSFRVPTKEEWEFAARGGIHSKGYIYSGSDNIEEVAYYKDNHPYPVGNSCFSRGKLKKPNELGLFDMSGGVYELTSTHVYESNPIFRNEYKTFLVKKERGEVLTGEDVEKMQFLESYICMGGAYDQPAEYCQLDRLPTHFPAVSGARIIMEY